MKLHRVYIGEYRVLRDLEIRFQPHFESSQISTSYSIDFLVGLNGSGKSTVLEAIAAIFRYMERNSSIPFLFEIEYDLGEGAECHHILISNRSDTIDSGIKVKVDGKEKEWTNDLLPSTIVAFTTGSEEEWLEEGFNEEIETRSIGASLNKLSADERAVNELPGVAAKVAVNKPEGPTASRFLLIRSAELPLVALCGILEHLSQAASEDRRGLGKVLKENMIKRICGFSLKFRINKGIVSQEERERILLLKEHATRALRIGSDRLLVFDCTNDPQVKAKALLQDFSDSLSLFRTLSQMQYDVDPSQNVLQQVNIFFERLADQGPESEMEKPPPLHLFTWLSDGEQSFLGRMGLFNLLRKEDALILFDEPEVHFNDYWKRQIVDLLDETLDGQNVHLLMTTHSSITLTDVPREDIVILDRRGAFTRDTRYPQVPTFAADPSDIMVHVFQTPFASGQRAISRIQRSLEAVGDRDKQKGELERLQGQVSPGYWSYRIRKALKGMEKA